MVCGGGGGVMSFSCQTQLFVMLGCVESWLSWGCDKIAKQVILRVLQTKYLKKIYCDKSNGVTSYNVSEDEKTKFCAKIL